jgi:hypothetical protein
MLHTVHVHGTQSEQRPKYTNQLGAVIYDHNWDNKKTS